MENYTYGDHVLLLEGLKVTQESFYPVFVLLYVFAIMANLGLVLTISMERHLHQPMYFLCCNLHLNDIDGATVVMPRLLSDLLTSAPERYISYVVCHSGFLQSRLRHDVAHHSHDHGLRPVRGHLQPPAVPVGHEQQNVNRAVRVRLGRGYSPSGHASGTHHPPVTV
ncbi:hypothetical protein DPEC_G00233170 [Dallia pectoralis]|uniref:Uncharacterized protein n=1 Tax=Dallia pectoralis TaxID=75939 RepID=A0ACC2FXP2_DALPE|nr:hypothetical protein DPEC_G00233170 [Dallia pectoralis]